MTAQKRRQLITFLVAGAAAVMAEHYMKPGLKRRLGV